MSISAEQLTPHDIDAERAVLGAILIDSRRLLDVAEIVAPGDFFRTAHRALFEAFCRLEAARKPIDLVTLRDVLGAEGLEAVGGPAYVSGLIDGVPRSSNAEHYSRIVQQHAIRRRLQAVASKAIADAASAELEAVEALEAAQAAMFSIVPFGRGDLELAGGAIPEIWAQFERAIDSKTPQIGQSTGFADLDRLTLGLHPGNLAVIAARPGMGKSALALQIAWRVAESAPVAFFSLEMSRRQLEERLLGQIARVNVHAVKMGRPAGGDRDLGDLSLARAEVCLDLFIDDTSTQTLSTIRGKARRLKARKGALGLVVVDYLQLLASERRIDNRVVEVGAFSRGLKQLAGELGVPVLALSQLSRAPEARAGGEPRLSDLRESGSIEQDANTVWLLHLPAEYDAEADPHLGKLLIAKNREGPTGLVELFWSKDLCRFDNRSDR